MSKRDEAMKLHKKLLRDDPQYREQWQHVTAVWRTFLADAELPEEDTTFAPAERQTPHEGK